MTAFSRPRAIDASDNAAAFQCGEPSLDDWLKFKALKNEAANTSRTFVTIERESELIAGYYCLSSLAVAREEAKGILGRNAPDPVSVILIGRVAVDERFKGLGLGASLLQDAVLKGIEASRLVGARAFMVHALDDSAVTFYERFGFRAVPESQRVMYLLTKDAVATVANLAR